MKHFRFAIPAVVSLALAAAAYGATIPYANDFSDAATDALPSWSSTQWSVADGQAINSVTAAVATASTASLSLDNASSTNFVLSTDVKIGSTGTLGSNQSDSVGFGAFANSATFATGSSSYYLADWTIASTAPTQPVGTLRLLGQGNAKSGVTGTAGLALPEGGVALDTTYQLRLSSEWSAGTLKLTLGLYDTAGHLIGTPAQLIDSNSPLTGTNFGFRNRYGLSSAAGNTATVSFDNLTASVPEPASAGLFAVAGMMILARRTKKQ